MNEKRERVAVVGGGTGSVGEGIVRALLQDGFTVVVPVRSDSKARALKSYVGDIKNRSLHCIPGDVSDFESIMNFKKEILKPYPHVDLVVACLGGWYYGYSLHLMPFKDWNEIILNNLTSHFLFMRALLSKLHEQGGGVYIMINGGAADVVIPESGAISIFAAAQMMMTKVLAEEAKNTGVRIGSVAAMNPLVTRDRGKQVMPDWISAEQLGEYVIRLYQKEPAPSEPLIHKLYTTKDL